MRRNDGLQPSAALSSDRRKRKPSTRPLEAEQRAREQAASQADAARKKKRTSGAGASDREPDKADSTEKSVRKQELDRKVQAELKSPHTRSGR